MLISVVAPLYNKQENFHIRAERVAAALSNFAGQFEIILVDDGSRDNTAKQIETLAIAMPEVRPILLARNYGQSTAIQAGLEAATGAIVATMDGDLQNDPRDIPRMMQLLVEKDVGVVSGCRADRNDGSIRKAFSRFTNWLIRRVNGIVERDFGCSLRVYRREIVERIRITGEMHRFISRLAARCGRNGDRNGCGASQAPIWRFKICLGSNLSCRFGSSTDNFSA